MASSPYSPDEIARLGREKYDRELRATVEPMHHGEYLVLDIETGEYEVDEVDVAAIRRAQAKNPGALLYIVRVGHPAAYKLGGHLRVAES